MEKYEITELIKDGAGETIGYVLNTGSIIDNEQAVYMIELGELSNVSALSNRRGEEIIKGKGFDINSLPELK
ncbi:MAG: hypothetical protein K0R09_1577 [Clostridiales bacterium]|jgi:hypothetical protein|nr:hypothetical protein [Clostridiales bacterium]